MGPIRRRKTRAVADDDTRPSGIPLLWDSAPALFGAIVGALAGVAFGFLAGPFGMLIGGLLGAVGGAGLGDAVSTMQTHKSLHDWRVDEDIGVIRGDVGAAAPDQEPAFIGAYSGGSAGVSGIVGSDATPDEGPFPKGE